MDAEKLLFSLIRIVICGERPDKGLQSDCTPEKLEAVYALALRHDLAHLVGQAVSQLSLPESETVQKCKQAAMSAFLRYVRLDQAYTRVCDVLESSGIPFIPLKGSVLRSYYPDAWMRTSCDMDILVHEEQLELATAVLEEKLQYRREKKGSHDVSLFSPEGIHLELHYSTIEDSVSSDAQKLLSHIWEDASPIPGSVYHLKISDAMFYYYHMAHMAKHFVGGGCGIRPFLDIWILNHRVEHNREAREQLLEKGNLSTFARASEKLSRVWFSGEAPDRMSLEIKDFILSGGTYGNLENRVSMNRAKKGGKLRYALSRIFLPYDVIKYHYPVLQKHKLLLPFYQVVRWCKLLFCGGAKRSVRELQVNASGSSHEAASATELLNYLGLNN